MNIYGRIPIEVFLFPLGSEMQSSDSRINLTPAIFNWTLTTSMNAPLSMILNLRNAELPRYIKEDERYFVQVTIGLDTMILATKRIRRDYTVDSGSMDYIINLESPSQVYSPKFSRKFTHDLRETLEQAYAITYTNLGLSPFIPEMNISYESVYGSPLMQFQTINEYIRETHSYAGESLDGSIINPVFTWEEFGSVNGASLRKLLTQQPIEIRATTSNRVGMNVGDIVQEQDRTYLFAIDFRTELFFDTEKYQNLQRTKYLVPQRDGSTVTFLDNKISGEIIDTSTAYEHTSLLYEPYEVPGVKIQGTNIVTRAHTNTLMELSRASCLIYNTNRIIKPGMFVVIETGNSLVKAGNYLVWSVLNESSNQTGQTTLQLIEVSHLLTYLSTTEGFSTYVN